MIRHLSCPRAWKFNSGDPASCSSWKNFSESFPVGPPGSIAWAEIQRSHSLMTSTLASLCFIDAHSQPRHPWAPSDCAGQTVKEGATPPRVNTPCPSEYTKLLNEFFTHYRLRQQFAASALPFPLRTVQILTRTQPSLPKQPGWGEFVPRDVNYGERVSSVQQPEAVFQFVVRWR